MAAWEPTLTEMLSVRYSALKGYAIVLCGDPSEADDLVQDAIVATFGTLRTFQNAAAAEGYVRRAIASRFVDGKRRDATKRRLLPRLASPQTDDSAGPSLLAEHATDVARALQTLPPRQRVCVVLRFLDQLSTRETADALKISDGAVKRYVSDAIARLAPLLDLDPDRDEPEWSETQVAR